MSCFNSFAVIAGGDFASTGEFADTLFVAVLTAGASSSGPPVATWRRLSFSAATGIFDSSSVALVTAFPETLAGCVWVGISFFDFAGVSGCNGPYLHPCRGPWSEVRDEVSIGNERLVIFDEMSALLPDCAVNPRRESCARSPRRCRSSAETRTAADSIAEDRCGWCRA